MKYATSYTILGLMSGTSVDGIDLAMVEFTKEEHWKFKILTAQTRKYSKEWQQKLRQAIDLTPDALTRLDHEYTAYLAHEINAFLKENQIAKVDAIASHGHTVLHRPEEGITYQIGNREELARLVNNLVICDFRVQDVKLGGQGAPLVPIGDQLLFSAYDACINIGGFANISYDKNEHRLAYDICPTNIVLNHYAEKLGMDYDKDGKIASASTINKALLKELNALPFYDANPPKSLGLEWVKKQIFPLLERTKDQPETIIATFTEHMAVQISEVLIRLDPQEVELKVLLTGGGAYNTYLFERIQTLSGLKIVVPQGQLIEFKEALVFAFMGVLRLRNTPNILKSVTGAQTDHCAGIIFTP